VGCEVRVAGLLNSLRAQQLIGMVILFNNLTAEEAETYALVLTSSAIAHRTRKGPQGWELIVETEAFETAFEAIREYLVENRQAVPVPGLPAVAYQRNFSGIWVALGLLACHLTVVNHLESAAIIKTFGASARHILDGEYYRCVTALMLHGDVLHLVSNMFGIAIFGTAVCTVTGLGVGWLMILLTGLVGNFFNALLYQTEHLSVGASTAVFGAIGILGAYQFLRRFRQPGQRLKAYLPLGAGLALLAFLGAGARSDLMAHLFGFAVGIVAGGIYGITVQQPLPKNTQNGFLVTAAGIVAFAWLKAF